MRGCVVLVQAVAVAVAVAFAFAFAFALVLMIFPRARRRRVTFEECATSRDCRPDGTCHNRVCEYTFGA